jgi:hypothetical protein
MLYQPFSNRPNYQWSEETNKWRSSYNVNSDGSNELANFCVNIWNTNSKGKKTNTFVRHWKLESFNLTMSQFPPNGKDFFRTVFFFYANNNYRTNKDWPASDRELSLRTGFHSLSRRSLFKQTKQTKISDFTTKSFVKWNETFFK